MGERRMFSAAVVESDAFLSMPLSAQALYFHLGMHCDDDGIVACPKSIARAIGAAPDDLRLIVDKCYLHVFDSGVAAVMDWRVHNTIRADRYRPSRHTAERESLFIKKDGTYTIKECLGCHKLSQVKSSQAKSSQVKDDDDKYNNDSVAIDGLRQWLEKNDLFCDDVDTVLNLVDAYGIDAVIDGVTKTNERSAITEVRSPLGYLLTILTNDDEEGGR